MAKRGVKLKRKTKGVQEKRTGIKYMFVPIAIALIASLIYLIWYLNNQNATYEHIDYIRSFMTSSGKLNDYQNKLMMHNPATDIKWYKTDDEIRIEFGNVILTWEPKDFYKQENLDHLGTIGITAQVTEEKDGTKRLRLYYMGEELERWVK